MSEAEIEATSIHEKKIRLTQRYHLIGDDCLFETVNEKCFLGKVIDVSLSGALACSKDSFGQEGDTVVVYLRMNLNDENQIISINSRIKNVRPTDDEMHLYGIEFIDTRSDLNTQLKNYMYNAMIL